MPNTRDGRTLLDRYNCYRMQCFASGMIAAFMVFLIWVLYVYSNLMFDIPPLSAALFVMTAWAGTYSFESYCRFQEAYKEWHREEILERPDDTQMLVDQGRVRVCAQDMERLRADAVRIQDDLRHMRNDQIVADEPIFPISQEVEDRAMATFLEYLSLEQLRSLKAHKWFVEPSRRGSYQIFAARSMNVLFRTHPDTGRPRGFCVVPAKIVDGQRVPSHSWPLGDILLMQTMMIRNNEVEFHRIAEVFRERVIEPNVYTYTVSFNRLLNNELARRGHEKVYNAGNHSDRAWRAW